MFAERETTKSTRWRIRPGVFRPSRSPLRGSAATRFFFQSLDALLDSIFDGFDSLLKFRFRILDRLFRSGVTLANPFFPQIVQGLFKFLFAGLLSVFNLPFHCSLKFGNLAIGFKLVTGQLAFALVG